jgi:uncharacterized repeat protein (TIGR03803 family)
VLAVSIAPVQAQKLKTLHQFNVAIKGEGANPHGALLRDAAGNLYGTTLDGGTGDGTVFKIDSTGKESILFAFDLPVSGSSPDTPLIQDQPGNLYGIVQEGGPGGGGLVYKLSPQGEQTILHSLTYSPGLVIPTGGLFMIIREPVWHDVLWRQMPTGCGTDSGWIRRASCTWSTSSRAARTVASRSGPWCKMRRETCMA